MKRNGDVRRRHGTGATEVPDGLTLQNWICLRPFAGPPSDAIIVDATVRFVSRAVAPRPYSAIPPLKSWVIAESLLQIDFVAPIGAASAEPLIPAKPNLGAGYSSPGRSTKPAESYTWRADTVQCSHAAHCSPSETVLFMIVSLSRLTAKHMLGRLVEKETSMQTVEDRIDNALDAALEMTFPASDPIAVYIPESRAEAKDVPPRSAGN